MNAEYINAHEPIYSYLLRYFLPDLSDPYFQQNAAHEIEQDERMAYCRYMAAWLPHEPHYDQILNQLKQLCESDCKAVKHIWGTAIGIWQKIHRNDAIRGHMLSVMLKYRG